MKRAYRVQNLGSFPIAPLEFRGGIPVTTIPWTQMAFEIMGPYWNPATPQRGRFATLPPWYSGFPGRK